jgi:undecaprenyl-diphosphatase
VSHLARLDLNAGSPRSRLLRCSVIALACFVLLVAVGLGLRIVAHLADGLDHRAIAYVVAHRSQGLTDVARALSTVGRSWVLIPATLILGLAVAPRLGWRAFGPFIAVLGAQQLQNIIKWIVDRPRPAVLHLVNVTGSSFPSGHATESAAVGVALILLTRGASRYKRIGATVVATALVVAIAGSRVYLGVHYPTDVVAGIILGSAWGAMAVWWCTNAAGIPPTRAAPTFMQLFARRAAAHSPLRTPPGTSERSTTVPQADRQIGPGTRREVVRPSLRDSRLTRPH